MSTKEDPTWQKSNTAFYRYQGFGWLGITGAEFETLFKPGLMSEQYMAFLYENMPVPVNIYNQFPANQDGYGPITSNDEAA